MKKIAFIFIVVLGYLISFSLEAAIALAPYNDEDLRAYGDSDPQFKASVWLDPACSASRVQLTENDLYDFYITAAHCVIIEELSKKGEKVYQEFLQNKLFDLETIECTEECNHLLSMQKLIQLAIDVGLIEKPLPTYKDFSDSMQSFVKNNAVDGAVVAIIENQLQKEEGEKAYNEILKESIFEFAALGCAEDCSERLMLHKFVRSAIDLGLIEKPLPTLKDFSDFLVSYIKNTNVLSDDDKVSLNDLKCIVHPSYKDDVEEEMDLALPSYDKDDVEEEEEEEEEDEMDLALCTTYKKNVNVPKYRLKFIKNYQDVQGEQLVSVSFGGGNITNVILDRLPRRQAFNTLVGEAWNGMEPNSLESKVNPQISIDEKPRGSCDSGDSGGTLLYKDGNGTYFLVGVAEAAGDATHWTLLDREFILEAYGQLMEKVSTDVEKEEL